MWLYSCIYLWNIDWEYILIYVHLSSPEPLDQFQPKTKRLLVKGIQFNENNDQRPSQRGGNTEVVKMQF